LNPSMDVPIRPAFNSPRIMSTSTFVRACC
jgi:hypothetical protein